MDAHSVKSLGDPKFVLCGEIDLFPLRTIPERGVIDQDRIHGEDLLTTITAKFNNLAKGHKRTARQKAPRARGVSLEE
jgi:hypothetical protein